jgi:hypothetical protein
MFHEKRIIELLEESIRLQRFTVRLLMGLEPQPNRIERFVIFQQETPMLALAPGNSPVFTATPVPSTSVPTTPPTWTTSDEINALITVDPTGLIATVAIPVTAVVGASFVLTVNYTNADGTVATGSFRGTIVSAPSPDIVSFTIEQTA